MRSTPERLEIQPEYLEQQRMVMDFFRERGWNPVAAERLFGLSNIGSLRVGQDYLSFEIPLNQGTRWAKIDIRDKKGSYDLEVSELRKSPYSTEIGRGAYFNGRVESITPDEDGVKFTSPLGRVILVRKDKVEIFELR